MDNIEWSRYWMTNVFAAPPVPEDLLPLAPATLRIQLTLVGQEGEGAPWLQHYTRG
jgi:hypothetical protein